MWFLGLIAGGLLGGAIGSILHWDEAWLLFAAIGVVAGVLYRDRRAQIAAPAVTAALERRIAALERQLREMQLRGHVPAGEPRADAQPALEPPLGAAPPATAPAAEPLQPAPATARQEASIDVAPGAIGSPAAPPPAKTPPPRRTPRPPAEPSWLYQKLFGGNILAKIGVVLLLIGVGSGLKLAIDFGMFPPLVRLLLATIAAIAMIGFGYTRTRMPAHRMFGLALQGGGFGVLYLVTYFAYARYGYLDPTAAFALFAGLGIACLATAWRFEGEPLAILGISGAFMAPLLAATGSGNYVLLFSYYAVLDAMVVAVTLIRTWRMLTLIAFAFTAVTGMLWAHGSFTPAAFAATEGFLIFFTVIFSLACVLPALVKREIPPHAADTVLLFGVPIVAAIAQSWLIERTGSGDIALAGSAVGAGIYYSALAALLFTRRGPTPLRIAHSAIAIGFYTIAVPLAFGVPATSALWAIEGLALAWFGTSQRRGLPYAAGLVLQLLAGVYFLHEGLGARTVPVMNAFYVGCLVIAACGACTGWITRRTAAADWLGKENAKVFPSLAGGWALAWWLTANVVEIDRFAPRAHESALYLGLLIVTAWALVAIGKALPSTITRYAALALAAAALAGGLLDGWSHPRGHPLHDSMALALPAAFATIYAVLRLNERDGLARALSMAHVFAFFVLAIVLLREALWIAEHLAYGVELWPLVAWMLIPAALAYAVVHLSRLGTWPFTTQRTPYLLGAAPVLLFVAGLAALLANIDHDGGAPGLPYVPVASFFDVAQIAVMLAVYSWVKAAQPPLSTDLAKVVRATLAGLAFIWLSAMAMRLAHHWGDVPFTAGALIASGLAQSMLSILWTAIALTLMISATRKVLRNRWFLGFALLGAVGAKFILVDVVNKGTVTWTLSLIGVGLLILAASYFSPAPPRAASAPVAPQ